MKTNKFLVAYTSNKEIVFVSDGSDVEIFPADGVTVKTFDTKEEMDVFIKENGLKEVVFE